MFYEWPGIDPDSDNQLLQVAERNLVEFLRSIYVKEGGKPVSDPQANPLSLICSN